MTSWIGITHFWPIRVDIKFIHKPQMGVGTPEDLLNDVIRGVDIFDCVMPTRLARHNTAMVHKNEQVLAQLGYHKCSRPIDNTCTCYTCQHFSRAYLRHLIVAKEMLSATLLSIHNLHTLIEVVKEMRQSILDARFNDFVESFLLGELSGK